MLKIWGRRNSFNVQKALWALGEAGVAHEHIDAGGQFGGLNTPEFRAMNPNGLIPVIDDGGTVVWESHAIVRYIAAKYGAGTLWPNDPGARSYADRWLDWAQTTLQPEFMGVFWGYYRTPEPQRNWRAINERIARTNAAYRLLDAHLATQPHLGGDAFTMGDIPAGASLYRWYELDIERQSFPNVEAWYARLQERPAFREHVMRPFTELRGRTAH